MQSHLGQSRPTVMLTLATLHKAKGLHQGGRYFGRWRCLRPPRPASLERTGSGSRPTSRMQRRPGAASTAGSLTRTGGQVCAAAARCVTLKHGPERLRCCPLCLCGAGLCGYDGAERHGLP